MRPKMDKTYQRHKRFKVPITWEKRSFQRDRQIETSYVLTADSAFDANLKTPLANSHTSRDKSYIWL